MRTRSRLLPIVASATMLAASSAFGADESLKTLAWLGGCWSETGAQSGSGEHWMPLAGDALLGMSRTVRDGKTLSYEFMRIATAPDGKLTFYAQPSGKPPGTFAVKTLTGNEVVFENLEHEFPQRVIYRLEGPATSQASIEGVQRGSLKRVAYPMTRVSCDALFEKPQAR